MGTAINGMKSDSSIASLPFCEWCGKNQVAYEGRRLCDQCIESGCKPENKKAAVELPVPVLVPKDPNDAPSPVILEGPDKNGKHCSRCKTPKLYTEFMRKSSSKDGRQSACGDCQNAHARERKRALRAAKKAKHESIAGIRPTVEQRVNHKAEGAEIAVPCADESGYILTLDLKDFPDVWMALNNAALEQERMTEGHARWLLRRLVQNGSVTLEG